LENKSLRAKERKKKKEENDLSFPCKILIIDLLLTRGKELYYHDWLRFYNVLELRHECWYYEKLGFEWWIIWNDDFKWINCSWAGIINVYCEIKEKLMFFFIRVSANDGMIGLGSYR